MKTSVVTVLLGLIVLSASVLHCSAGATIEAQGVLTEITSEQTLRIDHQGYLIGKGVRIFDGQEKEILLHRLNPPTLVRFLYEYTAEGPMISRIDVIPQ